MSDAVVWSDCNNDVISCPYQLTISKSINTKYFWFSFQIKKWYPQHKCLLKTFVSEDCLVSIKLGVTLSAMVDISYLVLRLIIICLDFLSKHDVPDPVYNLQIILDMSVSPVHYQLRSCFVSNGIDAMIRKIYTRIKEALMMSVRGVEIKYAFGLNFLSVSWLIQL